MLAIGIVSVAHFIMVFSLVVHGRRKLRQYVAAPWQDSLDHERMREMEKIETRLDLASMAFWAGLICFLYALIASLITILVARPVTLAAAGTLIAALGAEVYAIKARELRQHIRRLYFFERTIRIPSQSGREMIWELRHLETRAEVEMVAYWRALLWLQMYWLLVAVAVVVTFKSFF